MGKMLITMYSQFADAQRARDALLADGFSENEVHFSAQEDEAGPQQGNAILEYKDTEHGNDRSVFDSLLTRDDPNEGQGRTPVAWQAELMVTIETSDDQQLHRAADIARRSGAVAIGEGPLAGG